ncbi:unnamed protein product [marine sediment metagenome]|uniref:Uncharacterized protein n=1 Tax=marine sediment metagenome TaxID=412755 RepID=X1UZP7_9ZZZZ
MNKIALVIVSLILAMTVGLGGCVVTLPAPPEPPQEAASPETSSMPESFEDLTAQDIRDQVTILEWPTEAYIGEDITVRIKTGSEEFWAWLEQELIDRKKYDSIWLNPYYSLYLMPARGISVPPNHLRSYFRPLSNR